MEDTIIQEIRELISADYNTFKPNIFFAKLLDYINNNRQVSRLFFSGNINATFYERITGLFNTSCIDYWCKENNVIASEAMDYYVQFCLSGGLGVIGMWISRDFEYPMETLATMLSEIDSSVEKIFRNKFS